MGKIHWILSAILVNPNIFFVPSQSFLHTHNAGIRIFEATLQGEGKDLAKRQGYSLVPKDTATGFSELPRHQGLSQESAADPVVSIQDTAPGRVAPAKLPVVSLLRKGASSTQLAFERMGPRISSFLVNFVVPLACVIGYFLTPSRRLSVSIVGGGLLGVMVGNTRQRLENARRGAAQVQVAKLIVDGLTNIRSSRGRKKLARKVAVTTGSEVLNQEVEEEATPGEVGRPDVEEVLKSYGLSISQMEPELTKIYQLHLEEEALEAASFTMGEDFLQAVDKLASLKRALGLTAKAAADAHVQAARKFWVSNSNDDKRKRAFLFLSERVFAGVFGEKEYTQQLTRLAKTLGMTLNDARACCQSVALPFYRHVLKYAINNPESSSAAVLSDARKSFGVDSLTTTSLHLEGYSMKVRSFLEAKAVPQITQSEVDVLARLRGVLGVSQFEGDRSLEAVAAPIYRELVVESIEHLLVKKDADAKQLRKALEERLEELKLTVPAANNILKEAIRRIFLEPFNTAVEHFRDGKVEELIQDLEEIQKLRIASSELLAKDQVEKVMTGILTGTPKVVVTIKEKIKMFGIYLEHVRVGEKEELTPKDEGSIKYLQLMLRLSSSEAEVAMEATFRDTVKAKINSKLKAGDLTPEALAEIKALTNRLSLPKETLRNYFEEIYALELTRATEKEVVTTETKLYLDSLVSFFRLPKEFVFGLHEKMCGPIFIKVLSEMAETSDLKTISSQEILKKTASVLGLKEEYAKRAIENAVKKNSGKGK